MAYDRRGLRESQGAQDCMKVIWTPKAASGLKQAVGYIAEDKTDAAGHLSARIYQSVMKLESTPYNGR